MKAIAVAIVGMGPRGLTVLERILEHAHSLPEASRLDIEVFEPGDCGQGVHPAGQSDHLLINTVASQVTMFAPGSVAGGEEGLSLVQWAHLSGYRRHGDRYLRTFEDSGRAITDADHLPRSLLGEYLSWVYRRVVGLLPAHVGVYHHKTRVVDIARHDGGFELALENGARRAADYVFLTTGHGYRKPSAEDRQFLSFVERRRRVNPSLEYYPSPYPIHALAQIPATATVGIQGFGLTAHDVIAALTTGRGGRYVEDAAGDLRYQRSGSRACCCSRATACRARHQPERTYRPAPGALFHAAGRAVPSAGTDRSQRRRPAGFPGGRAAPDHPGNGLCASRRRHWSRGGCRHVRAQPGRARRHRGHPVAAAQASVRVAGRVPGFSMRWCAPTCARPRRAIWAVR